MNNAELIEKLSGDGALLHEQWLQLLNTFTDDDREFAASLARKIAVSRFGKRIFIRGIIEFSNYCKNNCLYCGIRRGNHKAVRYRLTVEEILSCCEEGYALGIRTFVLQSGEDPYFTGDILAGIISKIRASYPDCAITLSIGEKSREIYRQLFDAGADRFLLRHETADSRHYSKLHPPEMSFKHRMDCLDILKDMGYQTGCGMMVGAPFQTAEHLARDMEFMHDFRPHMIGMGPFIPHGDTPFAAFPQGDVKITLFLLSLCRIMLPDVLLPATTALGTVDSDGRRMGILAGANVIMPNLSPMSVRKKYMLYDNKAGTAYSTGEYLAALGSSLESIGYIIISDRGDYKGHA